MKILVVQLLRLGDILQCAPILKALKQKHPQSEITLLINNQFISVKPLMPYVDRIVGFDRGKIQRKMKHKNIGFYCAFIGYRDLVQYLKNQKFNLCINLTHTKMSGYLCGLIQADRNRGLLLDATSLPSYGHDGFKNLNQHGLSNQLGGIHYNDLFAIGCELNLNSSSYHLQSSLSGWEEVKNIIGQQELDLLIQPLTSDPKKNWPLKNFEEFILQFSKQNLNSNIGILASHSEVQQLQDLYLNLREQKVRVHLLTTTLDGALCAIQKSKLLVTCDTSIKHLAAATNTRVIELSLGSSHLQHTGIHRKNAWIIQAQESCAPCSHSSICTNEFKCHSNIDPGLLTWISGVILRRDYQSLNNQLPKYKAVKVYRTCPVPGLGWLPVPLVAGSKDLFYLIHSVYRLIQMNGLEIKGALNSFLKSYKLITLGSTDWLVTLMELKHNLQNIRQKLSLKMNAIKILQSQDVYLNYFLSYHAQEQQHNIPNPQVLDSLIDKTKDDLDQLLTMIEIILYAEGVDLWTKKVSNNLETL